MTKAMIFPFNCTDTTLPLQDLNPPTWTSIPGATVDVTPESLPLGSVPSLRSIADATVLTGTASVVDEGALRVLHFDGVDDYLSAEFTRPTPHTLFVRFRVLTMAANKHILSSTAATRANFATTFAGTNVMIHAGSALNASPAVNDNVWHTAIIVVNGASTSLTIDGNTVTGNAGTNPGQGFRLAAGYLMDQFTHMRVARAGYIPYAADATLRGQIKTILDKYTP